MSNAKPIELAKALRDPESPAKGHGVLRGWRWLCCLAALVSVMASTPVSLAEDTGQMRRDVVAAGDFRVRVAAALALGKKKDTSALSALTAALKDDNAAVRVAAASALAMIGDGSVIPAIERAREVEKDANAKKGFDQAISTLKAQNKTKFIVSVSKIENKSGNPKVSSLFSTTVKEEIARIPGVEVASSESDAVAKAKAKNLPTIALDSRLVALSKSNSGADVAVAAKVEFLIRKIPEQSLKATVKGDAKALANSKSVKGEAELGQLQADAVQAAVKSALKGAPTAIEAAAK